MGRIIHFEIHAADFKRATVFYGELFGWKFESWGDGSYSVITTGPDTSKGINGGMTKRTGPAPTAGQAVDGFVNIIEVPSVDEYTKKILAAGGSLSHGKETVPSMGYSAYFRDPEGNLFGIFQIDAAAK
ncbi:MAG TPA: VOC family protein [Rectinemataceae bacterium]|nr:VOC family protein [Rectinemataceae bacterium]